MTFSAGIGAESSKNNFQKPSVQNPNPNHKPLSTAIFGHDSAPGICIVEFCP